jgi:dTDP-4-dehydrorhamnose 3,5-epimerase
MTLIETDLPGVVLLQPKVFGDARGFFMETYNQQVFQQLTGVAEPFVQDNHSRSSRGILRGLHYQIQNTQGKMVRAVRGEVWDVAVDLRRSSPHFGRSTGFLLSEENQHIVWVPPGFAHGFLVLSETADVVYKTTDFYAPAHERVLLWNDPALKIQWPIDGITPQLNARDAAGKPLAEAETFA